MVPIIGVLEWKDIDSSGRIGSGDAEWVLTLYVNDQKKSMELCLGMDMELTENGSV